jgi:hypothetical protein
MGRFAFASLGWRVLASGVVAGLFGAGLVLWPALAAQTAATRIPDFSEDSSVGWLAAGTEFIAMPSGPHPVMPDPAHPYVPNGRGQQPTLRVADLDNPILQPWVKEALKKVNERTLAGKGNFPPQVRCWPLGVPAFVLYPAQPIYFVQTPKEVVITWQSDHMVRHVFLTDKHSANPKPSWFGESIGHYENGDTLVVDTIGLNDKTFVDNYRTPHTDRLHVVERYKIVNAETAIEVTLTIEDPGAFTMPWSAMQRYHRIEVGPMGESTCVEGNFNYFNLDLDPLPMADKADF